MASTLENLPSTLKINDTRLLAELRHLATFTDCPPTTDASLPAPTQAVTRIVFTPRDLEARAYIRSLAHSAGFETRVDPVGNTFLRWPGSNPSLAVVGTGSHTDAIPHAGMYDGTVGVLGGIEAMRSLKESGFVPKRSIETLMLTSEEPTRFGIGCLGSRLIGGALNPATADALPELTNSLGAPSIPQHSRGMGGTQDTPPTLHDVRTAAGFTGPLTDVLLPTNYFHAWVELHIEQGPLLERDNINVGIVTNIAAPASYRYEITGFGGHAGALLMPDRRDALCAAAKIILSVERHTLAANAEAKAAGLSGVDSVATVGSVAVHPGNVNSVPSLVTLMLDIRDTDVARRDRTMAALHADIADIQSRRRVTIAETKINADIPAVSSDHIVSTLESICQSENISYQKMVSRAYHDSTFIARIAPIAMLFIPCRNGVSHRPDEYATPAAITQGTRILALTLAQLSNE